MDQQQFLKEASDAAVIAQNSTGVPAEALMAQAILESGWGQHMPGWNLFGIKIYPNCYGRQLLHTVEWFTGPEVAHFLSGEPGRTAVRDTTSTVITDKGREKYKCQDWFATFPTLAACFERRALMFQMGRYKPFADAYAADHDLTKLIKGIATIYATSPDYADTLLKIIGQRNVTLALSSARGGDIVA